MFPCPTSRESSWQRYEYDTERSQPSGEPHELGFSSLIIMDFCLATDWWNGKPRSRPFFSLGLATWRSECVQFRSWMKINYHPLAFSGPRVLIKRPTDIGKAQYDCLLSQPQQSQRWIIFTCHRYSALKWVIVMRTQMYSESAAPGFSQPVSG